MNSKPLSEIDNTEVVKNNTKQVKRTITSMFNVINDDNDLLSFVDDIEDHIRRLLLERKPK